MLISSVSIPYVWIVLKSRNVLTGLEYVVEA